VIDRMSLRDLERLAAYAEVEAYGRRWHPFLEDT